MLIVLEYETCANDFLLGRDEIAINMINVIGRAIKVLGLSVVPLILVEFVSRLTIDRYFFTLSFVMLLYG